MSFRRAFTLIELLTIVAILATMVTIGIGSIRSGQGAARVKGATRDIFGAIRHARSVALVTGKPAIVTYSTVTEDGEVMAKVEITSAKLFETQTDRSKLQTLSGDPLKENGEEMELVHISGSKSSKSSKSSKGQELVHIEGSNAKGFSKSGDSEGGSGDGEMQGGETMEEILFAPVSADVVKGMRLKVLQGGEELETNDSSRKMKISVFSNVDYLVGRYKEAKAKQAAEKAAQEEKESSKDAAPAEDQEPVSIVWETNGRVEPHKVWVYPDGKRPEDGLLISIDQFGAAKVLPGDGKE